MNKVNDLANIAKTDLKFIEKRFDKKKPFVKKIRKDIDKIKHDAKKGNVDESIKKITEINMKVENLKNKIVQKENRMKPFYKLVNKIKKDQQKVDDLKRETFKSIDKLKYEKKQDYKRIHDVLQKLYTFLENVADSFRNDRKTQVKYLTDLVEKLNQNKEFVRSLNFYLSEKGSPNLRKNSDGNNKTPLTDAISNVKVPDSQEIAKNITENVAPVASVANVAAPASNIAAPVSNVAPNILPPKINKNAVANKVKVLSSQYKNGKPANVSAPVQPTANKSVLDIFGLPI